MLNMGSSVHLLFQEMQKRSKVHLCTVEGNLEFNMSGNTGIVPAVS